MINIKLGIECTSTALLSTIGTNADVFWIHLDKSVETSYILDLVENFVFSENLSLIMTSGKLSERLHDKFDDLFERSGDQADTILTVWSEDSFSESLWEFVNVYADRPEVRLAKILIVSESIPVQMKILDEIAAMAWAE